MERPDSFCRSALCCSILRYSNVVSSAHSFARGRSRAWEVCATRFTSTRIRLSMSCIVLSRHIGKHHVKISFAILCAAVVLFSVNPFPAGGETMHGPGVAQAPVLASCAERFTSIRLIRHHGVHSGRKAGFEFGYNDLAQSNSQSP